MTINNSHYFNCKNLDLLRKSAINGRGIKTKNNGSSLLMSCTSKGIAKISFVIKKALIIYLVIILPEYSL
jgi:hypothetical protein